MKIVLGQDMNSPLGITRTKYLSKWLLKGFDRVNDYIQLFRLLKPDRIASSHIASKVLINQNRFGKYVF